MANRLTYGLSTITLKLPIHRPIFNFNSSISFASPLTVDKSPSTTLTPFSKSLGPISTIKIEVSFTIFTLYLFSQLFWKTRLFCAIIVKNQDETRLKFLNGDALERRMAKELACDIVNIYITVSWGFLWEGINYIVVFLFNSLLLH